MQAIYGPYAAAPGRGQCPHCGQSVPIGDFDPAVCRLVLLLILCPACQGEWEEISLRGERTRYWAPGAPARAGRR